MKVDPTQIPDVLYMYAGFVLVPATLLFSMSNELWFGHKKKSCFATNTPKITPSMLWDQHRMPIMPTVQQPAPKCFRCKF